MKTLGNDDVLVEGGCSGMGWEIVVVKIFRGGFDVIFLPAVPVWEWTWWKGKYIVVD